MNKDKINKFVLKGAEDLMKAKPSIPLSTAVAVMNYKMANICSQLKVQIDTESGYPITPANLYQLLLLNSGGGKGASLALADNFYFKEAFNYIDEKVYPMYKEKALKKLELEENDRPLHSWVAKIQNVASASALLANAESYSLAGVGGINIEVDEIGNALVSKAELFELLLQPYDNGVFDPIAKRTDPNAITVKNMCVNLYAFGNKVRLFEGDNVENSFIKLLDEGYGRRFIFTDDNSKMERKTGDDVMREMEEAQKITELRKSDREYIRSLITKDNLSKTLKMDREAKLMFAVIKADGDNYILDNDGLPAAVRSDMAERFFKTAKLAGIYAFFEGCDVINKKHMEEAFEVIQESSKVLVELRKIKPTHERLLDYMIKEKEPFTAQHLLSYPFINSTWTKKIIEIIDLSKELASERGYIWKESLKKGVTYYSVNNKKNSKEEKQLDEVDKKEAKEVKELSDEKKKLLEMLYN